METQAVTGMIVLIVGLAVAAQWTAWRLKLPGIVLLAAAGLIAGPALGLLNPREQFGHFLQPMISLAVAVILFEGGMHLKFADLRGVGRAVWRLAALGAPLAMGMTAWAAHATLGLSWPVALLFGGVMVVTGPTVIMPLLRQARLRQEPAALLKWEGIVNDPIGALLAVLVFELATRTGGGEGLLGEIMLSLLGIGAASALGFALARGLARLIHLGLVPEFVMGPLTLALVFAGFWSGNLMQHEAGLATVTVFGMTLANTGLADIEQIRRLKEYITVLLVSALFIVLSASLDPTALFALGWPAVVFLGLMLFVIRPASILVSTIGAGVSWPTRLLSAWIAPRGIVAIAVTGLFSQQMVAAGFEDAALLGPLSFAVVFATVLAHGFSLGPLARALKLSAGDRQGVLMIGANPWSTALARALAAEQVAVLLADANPIHLRQARRAEIRTYRGEILSEFAEHLVDLAPYQHVLAVSDDDAYNALVCSQFGPEMGRRNTVQFASHQTADGSGLRAAARGRVLIDDDHDSEALDRLVRRDWRFLTISARDLPETTPDPEQAFVVARISERGALGFALSDRRLKFEKDDRVILFVSPDFADRAARLIEERARREATEAEASDAAPSAAEDAAQRPAETPVEPNDAHEASARTRADEEGKRG